MLRLAKLKMIAEIKELTNSDLARMAGVSRQAVSLWFLSARADGSVNVKLGHALRLANGLGVSIDDLTRSFPILGTEDERVLKTQLLWDHLYPSVLEFVIAIVRGEWRALGRLVQSFGLFQAAKIAGKTVWKSFPKYKKFIEPKQRGQWEGVWNLQKNLQLI